MRQFARAVCCPCVKRLADREERSFLARLVQSAFPDDYYIPSKLPPLLLMAFVASDVA